MQSRRRTRSLDDACIAAICENLALETLIIEYNSLLTPRVVDIILGSKTAQSLSDATFYSVGSLTSANMLRLARGCPQLVDLCWYLGGLTPLTDNNGQNVDELEELLEARAKQTKKTTYYEVDDVFALFGPWEAASYHYKNFPQSQHPPSL